MEAKATNTQARYAAKFAKWTLWFGIAISIASLFIPGQFCMDGCSYAQPNFLIMSFGLILVGAACVSFASRKKSFRAALVASAVFIFAIAVDCFAMAINGWYAFIFVGAEIVALPFVLVGLVIWAIARNVAKNRKIKSTSEIQAPAVE